MNTARLRMAFTTASEAQAAGEALAPDNGAHLQWHVDGTTLVLEASAASMQGLLRSLEDVLGCLRATGMP